jgi:pimeloyl-ACP methyl ester carboxylesterase
MLTVDLPTLVLWAMDDRRCRRPARRAGRVRAAPDAGAVPGATHWIVHEQPAKALVA